MSSGFSTEGSLISASTVPHCGRVCYTASSPSCACCHDKLSCHTAHYSLHIIYPALDQTSELKCAHTHKGRQTKEARIKYTDRVVRHRMKGKERKRHRAAHTDKWCGHRCNTPLLSSWGQDIHTHTHTQRPTGKGTSSVLTFVTLVPSPARVTDAGGLLQVPAGGALAFLPTALQQARVSPTAQRILPWAAVETRVEIGCRLVVEVIQLGGDNSVLPLNQVIAIHFRISFSKN